MKSGIRAGTWGVAQADMDRAFGADCHVASRWLQTSALDAMPRAEG